MPDHAFRISLSAAVLLALAPCAHAATLYVANNGVDGPGCGAKETPCRSITQAIVLAAPQDGIIVGPGRYGDLDNDGTVGETGEEIGSPGCGCMLSVNKSVKLRSSDGAAATVIDANTVNEAKNVLIITTDAEFGKPGKGFTVTNTGQSDGDGIVIDGQDIVVRGNQIVRAGFLGFGFAAKGIETVDFPQTILIEANQVTGWKYGVYVNGEGKTVRKNQVSRNDVGIYTARASIVGNVVTANLSGIQLEGSAEAVGNAVYGNNFAGFSVGVSPLTGPLERNNIFGNGCGLDNFTGSTVLASNNFWGAATGPGADPADDVCQGTTTVAPVATKPFKVRAKIKP